MHIRFTKMHSLGNDFMVLDGIQQTLALDADLIRKWSSRHRGIGFDQCLVLETSRDPDIDFFYRIFNADGSEVGQCGNGARCLARYIEREGFSDKKKLKIATQTTTFSVSIDHELVSVQFSPAQFLPEAIPLAFDQPRYTYPIPLKHGQVVDVHALSVGNPHAVFCVQSIENAPLDEMGKAISEHPLFPQHTNVEFMALEAPSCIKLRVYERGCGETLACGSGAVAAAIIARKCYDFNARITVSLPGGILTVHCPNPNGPTELIGPAEFVYEGQLI